MQQSDYKRLGWTESCCICGRCVVSWHNPEPLRDGSENCCDACNRLVIAAREKIWRMPQSEQDAYARMLRDIPYESLKETLYLS